ncbi:hypothetical protein LOTGIDRAFT_168185 [Lottia gigantea]|uniref:C-type lectin domain-containing protein n=1 Tax=Lottia gigantea TaxID=225164 RepID=V3Z2V0_LOTGI|nr:hypothetical protein LOTGIDRAFT_168185 [Lottia gigantea]ESO84928.1 hypothetical protein LOTGIDRAFT_168185 [Lottia gigantea]
MPNLVREVRQIKCPTDLGYMEDPTSNICSKIHETKLSWTSAQAECEKDNGQLFIADTQAKRDISIKVRTGAVFLGASDLDEEGVWKWLNGEPVNRTLFSPNEPNNFNGHENCMSARSTGYNDEKCSRNFKYICEVPTKKAYCPN